MSALKDIKYNLEIKYSLALILCCIVFEANGLELCIDENYWFPYTFVRAKEPVGLHKDLVQAATDKLGHTTKFYINSWPRCLMAAKQGAVDGIVSISYTATRASYINYPEDAAVSKISKWRLSQVAYYLVTPLRNEDGSLNIFKYHGDCRLLPHPVRVENGYSIADYLKTFGVEISYGPGVLANFRDLVNNQTGSAVAAHETVEILKKKPPFRRKIYLHKQPLLSKSYFLGFSKKTVLSRKSQRKIWQTIKELREDQSFIKERLQAYGFD